MPQHGKYATYNNHDCRCESCCAAARDYMAKYRSTERGRNATRRSNRVAAKASRLAAKYVRDNLPEVWDQCQSSAKASINANE